MSASGQTSHRRSSEGEVHVAAQREERKLKERQSAIHTTQVSIDAARTLSCVIIALAAPCLLVNARALSLVRSLCISPARDGRRVVSADRCFKREVDEQQSAVEGSAVHGPRRLQDRRSSGARSSSLCAAAWIAPGWTS